MNGLIYFRIDARLIHGQVAAFWTNHLGASRIMVVSDEYATNEIQKSMLKMATPPGINLSVLTVEKATTNIKNGNYKTQKVFVIFGEPETAARFIEAGVPIPSINVGNMSYKQGMKEIVKNVNCGDQEFNAFDRIIQSGTQVFHQLVPSSEKIDLVDKLKNR